MLLVNSSTNTLTVSNQWGIIYVTNGPTYWPVDDLNIADCGAHHIEWSKRAGDWTIVSSDSILVALDENRGQTPWFWAGFTLLFLAGIGAIGARWTRRAATD